MKLDGWWESFSEKHRLTATIGLPQSKDEKGNPYICLCIGGPKAEGMRPLLFATNIATAIDYFERSLLEFLAGRKTIVWRQFPELHFLNEGNVATQLIQVYCRLTAYP